jgi:hypothetical protein
MKTQKLKKAGLGTIVKSLRGAAKGAKQGYKTAKTLSKANPQGYSNRVFDNEFAKNVSESVKKSSTVQKKDAVKNIKKGYGDKGQYERLEDMKRSEFYRDRRNSGKSMPDSRDAVAKTKLKAMGLGLGVLGTSMLAEAALGSKKKKPAAKKPTAKKSTTVKKK